MAKKEFNTTPIKKEKLNRVLNSPTEVSIKGNDDYGGSFLTNASTQKKKKEKTVEKVKLEAPKKEKARRGRPIEIKDERYRVNKPKMISSALDLKLKILQDCMEEFTASTKRVSFEQLVDTLAESYIKRDLTSTKQKFVRSEFEKGFETLKK